MLAYHGDDVVGWCSIAPRESYAAIVASRTILTIEGADVWSVVCFFVVPSARQRGLPALLLDAGCTYAASVGASVVEAYPWPGGASYRYMGTAELYATAGFQDIPVPHGRRRVMRRTLTPCDH